jgi:hypothetical protein
LPEESVTTLQVATYLVADRNVPGDAISHLARRLFEERQKMSPDAAVASLVKAASTDKDAIFTVHPGAKVYYDGEETTLMERYGDWLFYGPMLLGMLGSALIGLMRFLRDDADAPALLPKFRDLVGAIKSARNLSELDAIRNDVDAAVMGLAGNAVRAASDQEKAAAAALVVSYINALIAERRELLQPGEGRHAATAGDLRSTAL